MAAVDILDRQGNEAHRTADGAANLNKVRDLYVPIMRVADVEKELFW